MRTQKETDLQDRVNELEERIKVLTGPMICQARIEQLEAENKALRDSIQEQHEEWEAHSGVLAAENKALREVAGFATHSVGCTCEDLTDSGHIFYRHDWPCSCGYRDALAKLEETNEKAG